MSEIFEYNSDTMTNERIATFESLVAGEMKKMTSSGFYPGSPFFPLAKVNAIEKFAKELKIRVRFEEADSGFLKLRRFRLFRNYKFLLFLTRIYYFKDYFKWYLTLDGHKYYMFPSTKMMDILKDYQAIKYKGIVWEPETTALVKEYVKPGMTCVDVGASVGYFTLLFARQVGKTGRVVAIEPTDFQQRYIKRNVKVNGYKKITTIVNVGAWDKDEIIKMPRNAPPFVQTELRCRPVDDILEELGIMKIDFIKIDVDGPEPNVLKGLIRTIERSPNLKMVIEYYPKYIRDAGLNPDDFMAIINKYFTYEVIPGDYSENCWNYLCKRKV